MIVVEPHRTAQLVAGIHLPGRATLADCLTRWSLLDGSTRAGSYLVIDGATPGRRHTLDGAGIAALAAQARSSERLLVG